ncbi:cathepsin W isoform X2 [Bos indicus]|uniref:Cathepsin W isoform X2 n=1 Tax=Bos indicus TaxID=9915 RepID=A0ABM4RTB4_BOSIN
MAPTVHLSCLLALLVAGLAQGIKDSLRGQDPGPQPLELKEVFRLFQMQYNRSYPNPAEYARRLDIFAQNLAKAQRLQEEDLGTAEFGVTQFSDLTEEEFVQLYGSQVAGEALGVSRKVGSEEWGESEPQTCDWRKVGTISPVRDQRNCNCCWAMAAAGNIEALWAIKFRDFVEVSVQRMAGGRGWGMARHLATEGPITVTINMKLLQQYQKGVIKATPTTCDPTLVDHSVLLVGFGKTKSVEGRQGKAASFGSYARPRRSMAYWTLKNSWGPQWGEEGYFRLHRGSNTCGITKFPVTARVDKPKKQHQVSCPP